MKAIVIKRKLSDSEIFKIQRLIDGKDKYDLFVCIDSIPEFSKYNPKIFELDPDIKRKINYDILDKILAFGDKTIDGKSISDWLAFNNSSIWYYHKFRTYFFVRNLYYKIAEVEYFSKNYEEVIYYTSNIFLKNYKEIPKNVLLVNDNLNNRKKINYISVINYFIFAFIRFLIGIFKTIKNKKYLIVDRSERQTIINFSTLKEEKDNYYLFYLLEKIDKEFLVISEVEIPKFDNPHFFKLKKEYFFNPKKKRKRIFGEYILIKAFLNSGIRKKLKKTSRDIRASYSKIQSGNLDPIEDAVINHFISLHKSSLYFIFKYLAYKNFFTKNKFISITSIDENSPSVKSIFDAAKFYGIKTIGIQHGNIYDLLISYRYTKKDAEKKAMADFTLVWGEYYKNFLTQTSNYPSSSIFVTGQLRTDIISKFKKIDTSQIFKEIDISKKIVVFATQPQPDSELRIKAASDVFKSVMNNKKAFLIIKLHPAEKNDFDFYNDIAKSTGCLNYKILYSVDLYLLLSISSLIITCYSTVGSEAIYFDKPLIILDYHKQDLLNYYKLGVAFQATDKKSLTLFINKIIFKDLKIDNEAYKKFIEQYAYRIDGNASMRCFNIIKSCNN
ncbi:MAG: CDP-glycerol glycerophosphotransferase family protein [Bacteroidales bacterium]|nr:CDP-glycerol glycerophosphotransferase family protein [Bacteroidales bacterium]